MLHLFALLGLAVATVYPITNDTTTSRLLSRLPDDVSFLLLQYMNNTRSFGSTCQRYHRLARQQELRQINKSFETLTSRGVVPQEFLCDKFTALRSHPSVRTHDRQSIDRRLRHLPLKQVRMFRTISSEWSRLIIPLVPLSSLCGASYYYLVFQFSESSQVELFGFIPDTQSTVWVTAPNGILELLETLYHGEVVRIQRWNTWREQVYWREERSLCARIGVSWPRRVCGGIKRMFQGFGCCVWPHCGHLVWRERMKNDDVNCDIVMTAFISGMLAPHFFEFTSWQALKHSYDNHVW